MSWGTYQAKGPNVVEQYEIVQGVDGKDYLFFWGGFLSQWAESNFNIGGIIYNCAEQYMMATKARHFGDEYMFKMIINTTNPSEQKRLGRKVKGFDKEEWDSMAQDVVLMGNLAKFNQNQNFKDKLLDTSNATLVEASPYDSIWGIKMYIDDPDILDPTKWKGTNWLGIVCGQVREEIRNEEGIGTEN